MLAAGIAGIILLAWLNHNQIDPATLDALAGSMLFGPVWGAILYLLGATLRGSFAFLTARYLAGDWVFRTAGGNLKWSASGDEGRRFVALVRLVPLFRFNLTNYALGLTRIVLLPYVLTSSVCMAPGGIAYLWRGHAGRNGIRWRWFG